MRILKNMAVCEACAIEVLRSLRSSARSSSRLRWCECGGVPCFSRKGKLFEWGGHVGMKRKFQHVF